MFRHRVGEFLREQGLSYSKFGRLSGVGMQTAKELYENPYYQMSASTLYKCCKFFGKHPGEVLVMEEPAGVA